MSNLEKIINDAWKNKDQISQNSEESIINAVSQTIRDRVNELDPIWSRDAKMLN